MTITAYIHALPDGQLGPAPWVEIEGVAYDIPARGAYGPPEDRKPSRAAPHRISSALEAAGYKRAYRDLSGPNADGVFEIQVEKS